MTTEEKARRYDEIIKKAESLYKAAEPMSGCNVIIETLFPEFKESEDERIREVLINYFKKYSKVFCNIPTKNIIAWLEKQGQKPKKVSIWKHWKNGIAGNGEGKLIYLVKSGGTYRLTSSLAFECDYIELSELDGLIFEKQGEQKSFAKYKVGDTIYYDSFGRLVNFVIANIVEDGTDNPMYEDKNGNSVFQNDIVEHKPADKVEPKFHEGDWVVVDNEVLHIKNITDDEYITEEGYIPFRYEEDVRLWTIQDAKDGDVLVDSDGSIFIFKEVIDNSCKHYIALTTDNIFVNVGLKYCWEPARSGSVKPATKEQRDNLERAMTDAGYTFDFDKKELKKVEQKPADKVETKFKIEKDKWYVCTSQYCNCIEGKNYRASSDGRIIDDYGTEYNMHDDAYKWFRPWTIQDAKDGDVLVLNNEVFIYAHRKQMYSIAVAHCFIDSAGSFYLDGEFGYKECGKTISPATKEQRDNLERAMADAGYTFDFVKKELKRIEQKPTDNEMIEILRTEYEKGRADTIAEMQKLTEWSEEDEKIYQSIMDDIVQENQLNDKQTNWLRDIKYRYFPQSKQGWGEKDKSMLNNVIETLKPLSQTTHSGYAINSMIDWLKSLRPQSQWKPSEGQLECLGYAIDKAEKDWSPLTNNRIYLTLKALKEQIEKL